MGPIRVILEVRLNRLSIRGCTHGEGQEGPRWSAGVQVQSVSQSVMLDT